MDRVNLSIPPKPITMAGRLAMPLLTGLRTRGVDVESILTRIGLDEDEMRSMSGRISMEAFMDLHTSVVAATGDRMAPLRMANELDRDAFPLAFHLLGTQATIRDGYRFVAPYRATIVDRIEYTLTEHGELAHITFEIDGKPLIPPAFAEYLIVLVLALGRMLIPDSIAPTEIHFAHRWPRHTESVDELVGCPVHFGMPSVCFVFPNPQLNAAITGADPHFGQILASATDQWMADQPLSDRLRDRARRWLGQRKLEQGEPTAAEVATALHMSERTLRRKLEAEGTSVRDLLDDVRKERAVAWLEEGRTTIDEIAFRLGFSGASAFRRAFKRWTGSSPAAFGDRTSS